MFHLLLKFMWMIYLLWLRRAGATFSAKFESAGSDK